MGKKIFLLGLGLLLLVGESMSKSLVLTLKDGTPVYYLLGGEVNPMLRFVDGGFTVCADKYEFAGIQNFYISEADDPNAIDKVVAEGEVEFRGGILVLYTNRGSQVNVYSSEGTQIDVVVQDIGNQVRIDLSTLPKGVYVIRYGEQSMKVMKK